MLRKNHFIQAFSRYYLGDGLTMFIIRENVIMKWLIILNIIFIQSSFANEKEDEEKFKKDAQDIYRSVNISSIVPFEAFLKGYTGYFKYRNRLNGAPIITFLNYSIPSNRPRLVTVDFQARTTPFVSHAAHGRNSASENGGPCTRNDILNFNGKAIPACQHINGVPGVSFSNIGNSLQSSLGFIMASDPNMGKVVGKSLILKGLEASNSQIESRSILFHDGQYVESGGNSWGCIAIPPSVFNKGYELLKNNTLIYSFEGAKMSSGGGDSSVKDEEIKEAASSSKNQNYSSTPDVSNVKKEKPAFEELEIAKAKPSLGAQAMGISAVGSAAPSSPPPELLKGTTKFEECQNLSDRSWEETVTFINGGGNPSECFRGSWSELHQTMIKGSVDNGEAMKMAEARTATINDCVAMAHLQHANYKMPNINQPQKKSTSDGSITCVYEGPESQDYQACLSTIDAHEALLKQEAAAHVKQETDFKTSSANRVEQVTGETAQSTALSQLSGLQTDHSNIALERADIASNKIDQLAAVASRIPTTDSLYDECKDKFAKHGTVSVDEYNQFAKVYMGQPKPFAAERDYCLAAVTNGTKPIQNQNAREEVKNVLKKFGREMEDYKSKSSALLNQSTLTPGLNESAFGMALTDLSLKTNTPGSFGGEAQKAREADGSILYDNAKGNANGSGRESYLERPNNSGTQGRSFAGIGSSSNNRVVHQDLFGDSGAFKGAGDTSGVSSGHANGSGIYDEDFNRKINAALEHPEKLASFNLSPTEMQEYNTRKSYKELMAKGANEIGGRAPALSSESIKDESPQGISSKELNLFEIISSRYVKKFTSGL